MLDDSTLARAFEIGYVVFGLLFTAAVMQGWLNGLVKELGDPLVHPARRFVSVATQIVLLSLLCIVCTFGWMPYLAWYLISMINGDEPDASLDPKIKHP